MTFCVQWEKVRAMVQDMSLTVALTTTTPTPYVAICVVIKASIVSRISQVQPGTVDEFVITESRMSACVREVTSVPMQADGWKDPGL
jgi:hypothetical protein